jgi:hypothetical protein
MGCEATEPTVICAWCEEVLVSGGESISHGICEACADELVDQIQRLKRPGPADRSTGLTAHIPPGC